MEDKKEIDILLARLRDPSKETRKNAAIDLEKYSKNRKFSEYQVKELIKIIRDIYENLDKNEIGHGLHTAREWSEPYSSKGQMLLLMEVLHSIIEKSHNDDIIDKEEIEFLVNVASDYSTYTKVYSRRLPQIRTIMILYYIDDNRSIDLLSKLLEIDEKTIRGGEGIPKFYDDELVGACILLSRRYGTEIRNKLYELINSENKNIRIKSQSILNDLRESNEQIINKTIISHLDQKQLINVRAVIDAINDKKLSKNDLQKILDTLKTLIPLIPQLKDTIPIRNLEDLQSYIDDPKLDVSHKIKINIPIIPYFLTYEGFIELKNGMNLKYLKSFWKSLLKRIR